MQITRPVKRSIGSALWHCSGFVPERETQYSQYRISVTIGILSRDRVLIISTVTCSFVRLLLHSAAGLLQLIWFCGGETAEAHD